MRTLLLALLAVMLMALVGSPTEAGQASTRVDLYVGSYDSGEERVLLPQDSDDWVKAGQVVFRLTNADGMAVRIRLKNGPANTTFGVRVVPKLPWEFDSQTYTMTTNAKGRASYSLELPVPDTYLQQGWVQVKIRLYDPTSGAAFATEVHTLEI